MVRFFSFVVLILFSVSRVYGDYPSVVLMQAIAQKESKNNEHVSPGDKKDKDGNPRSPSEWAYGHLQIRSKCITDVNNKFGTHFRSVDCQGNRALSEWVFREYINMYATKKLLGHTPTNEDMARIWNGGPNGYKSSLTVSYWRSVSKILTKLGS